MPPKSKNLIKVIKNITKTTGETKTSHGKGFTSFELWKDLEKAASEERAKQIADEKFRTMQEAQEKAAARQAREATYRKREEELRENADDVRFGKSGRMRLITKSKGSGVYTPIYNADQFKISTTGKPSDSLLPGLKVLSPEKMDILRQKLDILSQIQGPVDENTVSMYRALDLYPNLFTPSLPELESEPVYLSGYKQDDAGKWNAVTLNGMSVRDIPDYFKYGPNAGFRRLDSLWEAANNYNNDAEFTEKPWVKVPKVFSNGVLLNRNAKWLTASPIANAMLNEYLAGARKIWDGTPLYSHTDLFNPLETTKKPYISPIIDSIYSTRINPNSILKGASDVEQNPNVSDKIKAMARVRKENALKTLQLMDAQNGIVTRFDANGKPFKVVPPGYTYPSTTIYSETLPVDFYDDSAVDDIGEYVIVNGEKYHFKNGGVLSAKSGIHIKKANRGKFTDYCGGKVTQECIQRGKHSSNPAVRKRATFADNARHWKHQNGGIIKSLIQWDL